MRIYLKIKAFLNLIGQTLHLLFGWTLFSCKQFLWEGIKESTIVSLGILQFFKELFLFVLRYSSLAAVFVKFIPSIEKWYPPKTVLPMGVIWFIGFYTAIFGLASQRYENRIDIIENRANAIFPLLALPNKIKKVHVSGRATSLNSEESKIEFSPRYLAIAKIPSVQNLLAPVKPEFWEPSQTFISLLADCKYRYELDEFLNFRFPEEDDLRGLIEKLKLNKEVIIRNDFWITRWLKDILGRYEVFKEIINEKEKQEDNFFSTAYWRKGISIFLNTNDYEAFFKLNHSVINLESIYMFQIIEYYHNVSRGCKRNEGIVTQLRETIETLKEDLKGVELEQSVFVNAKLGEANFEEAYLDRVNFQGADLSGANLKNAELYLSNLEKANLNSAKLQDSMLGEANLKEASLKSANLKDASLMEAGLQGANLDEAILVGVDLSEAKLINTNLQNADLQRANLQRANLQSANLQSANLELANLKLADLNEADFKNANLSKVGNLNCWQIKFAIIYKNTKIPEHLDINWKSKKEFECKVNYEKKQLQYYNFNDANLSYRSFYKVE